MKFRLFKRTKDRPTIGLEEGWQFYSLPTELDPPGTVYRINSEHSIYKVTELKVPTEVGREAGVRTTREIKTRMGILARFLGIDPVKMKASAGAVRKLVFRMSEPQMEQTTDMALKDVLSEFKRNHEYDAYSRYFVIRSARSASGMTYSLSRDQFGEIGDEASITTALAAGVSLGAQSGNSFEIEQVFPTRMRVMFLPEEIKPLSAAYDGATPELGLVPVKGLLEWDEPA